MHRRIFLSLFFTVFLVAGMSAGSSAEDVFLWLSVPAQVYPGETVEARLSVSEIPRVQFVLSRIQEPAEYIKKSRKEHFFDVGTWRPDRPLEQREHWQNLKYGFFQSLRILASRLLPDGTKVFLRDLLGITGPLTPRLIEVSPADYRRGTEWLKSWDEEIRYSPDSRYAYTSYQIGALQEGLYLLTVSGGGREARVLFSVSRLALSMKQESDRSLFFLQDPSTGNPQAGVPIQVIVGDEVVAEGVSDLSGTWMADLQVENEAAVIAGEDGRYAFLSFWPLYRGDNEEIEAFLYSERPLYRPGQRVFFRGILRTVAVSGYLTPPAGETVIVRLTDYLDNEYGRLELRSNEFGAVSAAFDLPKALHEGGYLLEMIWRGSSFYHYVGIENYEKPAFEINLTTEQLVYANREKMLFNLRAVYYSGEPMTPAWYRYRVLRYPLHTWGMPSRGEMVLEKEGELDEQGQAVIQITPEVDDNAYRYEVTAQVFDPAYRVVEKTVEVKVLPGDYSLILEPERYFGEAGTAFRWTVSARDARNRLILVGKVFASVKELTWNSETQEYDEQLKRFFTFSLSEGQDTIAITLETSGYYLLEIMSQDASGNRIRSARRFYVVGAGLYIPTLGVEMKLDKTEYRTGENARVLITPPIGSGPFHFLFTVEGRSIHHHAVKRIEGPTVVVFPVESAHALGCFVSVTAFSGGSFYNETLDVPVKSDRELDVMVTIDKESFRPGEPGNIHIRVLGPDGMPRQAEVSLTVADQAIFDMSWFWQASVYDHFYTYNYNRVFTLSSHYTSFYGQGTRILDS
ncbi:MAG TPA: MG2 domain-containing protein, partial [Atribacteraceae bacterium]|nr:MG2 domain-containing protein [Atribacteraceae bacterium]